MVSLSKLFVLRRLLLTGALKPSTSSTPRSFLSPLYLLEPSNNSTSRPLLLSTFSRSFCSRPSSLHDDLSEGSVAVDCSSLLQEDEFHRLADSTIHDLLEKIEEYGDSVNIDGFDIEYGVLTMKLGSSGTNVLNKQTPNRQIWMSSPVSVSASTAAILVEQQ